MAEHANDVLAENGTWRLFHDRYAALTVKVESRPLTVAERAHGQAVIAELRG
jgi:hypothetical protein